MNRELRYLLAAVFAIVEALTLAMVLPLIVLAILAYILLLCVRAAGRSVRDVTAPPHQSETGAYDSARS
jgi:hypothetical protein